MNIIDSSDDEYEKEEPVKIQINTGNIIYECDKCSEENKIINKNNIVCKKCSYRVFRKKRINEPVQYKCR